MSIWHAGKLYLGGNDETLTQGHTGGVWRERRHVINDGSRVAFYIETVIVVLAFFLVMSVLVQFFGQARVDAETSTQLVEATNVATSIAEQFQASSSIDDLADNLGGNYKESGNSLYGSVQTNDGIFLNVEVDLSNTLSPAGILRSAHIEITSDSGASIYTLSTTKYQVGDAQ